MVLPDRSALSPFFAYFSVFAFSLEGSLSNPPGLFGLILTGSPKCACIVLLFSPNLSISLIFRHSVSSSTALNVHLVPCSTGKGWQDESATCSTTTTECYCKMLDCCYAPGAECQQTTESTLQIKREDASHSSGEEKENLGFHGQWTHLARRSSQQDTRYEWEEINWDSTGARIIGNYICKKERHLWDKTKTLWAAF